ncbi:MAG: CotH kinase family protein, partial [Acidobacteriota bacterium]
MVRLKLLNAPVVLALLLGVYAARAPHVRADDASGLLDAQSLQRLDIDLHSADWEKLREDFQSNDYYPADITWNGIKAYNAGVRSRGVASRNGRKPGLKLDFNHYASSQTFLGLKALVLDNLAQDPSGVHESGAMWFFARLGLPEPREAHAVVYVRGVYAGLYTIVEPVDQNMIARVFGSAENGNQNDGYLYEFNKAGEWWMSYLGSDIDLYKPYFDAKTHKSQDDETLYRPIEALVRLINEKPASELKEAVGPYLDLNELVRFIAVQNFLGEIDGFAGKWGMNNFYLYRLQHHDQHVLIAWDDDLTFLDPSYDLTSFQDNNVLVKKLMDVPEYRALYYATLDEAVRSALEPSAVPEVGAFEFEIRRQLDQIDAAMLADTLR